MWHLFSMHLFSKILFLPLLFSKIFVSIGSHNLDAVVGPFISRVSKCCACKWICLPQPYNTWSSRYLASQLEEIFCYTNLGIAYFLITYWDFPRMLAPRKVQLLRTIKRKKYSCSFLWFSFFKTRSQSIKGISPTDEQGRAAPSRLKSAYPPLHSLEFA